MLKRNVFINLPKEVEYIINKLDDNGFEAYIVGGCVRDMIMGRKPQDWDITTNAKPEDVKKVFGYTIDTGIKHGTVSLLINENIYEITTYRIDGEYIDNRHPENVKFTSDLAEDLLRRDFTINAMAYNHRSGLVDIYGGEDDIKNQIVKCVGVAYNRFSEDALRILRAIRFSAKLSFVIEKDTYDAMKLLSFGLDNISKERIRDELIKILISEKPECINIINDIGATKVVFDVSNFNEMDAHITNKILATDSIYIKTAFLMDYLGLDPEATLRYLKLDNTTIKKVKLLSENKDIKFFAEPIFIRKLLNKIGMDNAKMLMEYLFIDKKICKEDLTSFYEELGKKPIFERRQLLINGNDLKKIGYSGENIGYILDKIMDEVIIEPDLNDSKDKLLEQVKKINNYIEV